MGSFDVGLWIAGILTLACYSLLYKENRAYRLVEHLYVGLGAGYGIVMAYDNVVRVGIDPLVSKGKWSNLIGIALGLLLFTRFSKSLRSYSSYPMSFIIGIGTAVVLRTSVKADILAQAKATMLPLNSLDNAIIVLGSMAALFFLSFTVGTKSQGGSGYVINAARNFGRLVLMITFGAAIGNAVQGRISLVIGRAQFLVYELLKVAK